MAGRKPRKTDNKIFASRLSELRKERDLKLREIGDLVGVTEGAVGSWVKGRRLPEDERLHDLANLFNVSIDYLLGNSNLREKAESINLNDSEIVYLPIIGTVKVSNSGLEFQDNQGKEWIEKAETIGGSFFWLRVKDNSMINEGILENDLVLIREQNEIKSGDIGVVIVGEEEGTLKRMAIKTNSIVLQSANNANEPRFFVGEEMNEVKIVGKAILVKRRLGIGGGKNN